MSIEKGPKKPEFIEVGGKKIKVGDKVKVETLNGVIEGGWTLKSFGEKKAVVVKEGTSLRRVVNLEDLKRWQTLPESRRNVARQYTPSRPEEDIKDIGTERLKRKFEEKLRSPEVESLKAELLKKLSERPARKLSEEDRRRIAEGFGIDTSKPNWEEELEKIIRRRVGA
jgi:hypothetical protein